MTHKCIECRIEAEGDDIIQLFYKEPSSKLGFKLRCKECYNKKSIKYNKKNKNVTQRATKKYRAKKAYNISLEEYEEAMSTSNICEVCGREDNLCYDHDHTTGKFRGVLCNHCNMAKGYIKSDITIAYNLYKYLLKHSK